MKPIFKCKEDKIEAHYCATLSDGVWLVQCFVCGSRAMYNTEKLTLTPYAKNTKGRETKDNIFIERFITDDGKEISMPQERSTA